MKVRKENSRGLSVTEASTFVASNTTDEFDIFTHTLPAYTLNDSKELHFSVLCNLVTGVAPPDITVYVKFGTYVLNVNSVISLVASLGKKPFMIEGKIVNNPITNSQYIFVKLTYVANVTTGITLPIMAINSDDFTIDTKVDQTFKIAAKFSKKSTTTTLTVKNSILEIT